MAEEKSIFLSKTIIFNFVLAIVAYALTYAESLMTPGVYETLPWGVAVLAIVGSAALRIVTRSGVKLELPEGSLKDVIFKFLKG